MKISHYGTYVEKHYSGKDNEKLKWRSVSKIDNLALKKDIKKEPLKQSSSSISFGGSFFNDFKKMVKFFSGFNDEISDYNKIFEKVKKSTGIDPKELLDSTKKHLPDNIKINGDKIKFKEKGVLRLIYEAAIYPIVKMPFDMTNKVCKSFTGVGIDELKQYEFIHEISPVEHVTKNFPKTCIVYSEKDIFCNGQGQDFIEKLKENNVYYEEYHSSKMLDNHTFPSIWKGKAAVEANNLYISFAKRLFENKI